MTTNNTNTTATNNTNTTATDNATLTIGAYEHNRRGYHRIGSGERISKRDILETVRKLGTGNDLIKLYVTVELAAMDAIKSKPSKVSDEEAAARAELDSKVLEYLKGLDGATTRTKTIAVSIGATSGKVTASLKRLVETKKVVKTYDKDGATYAAK